MEKEKSIIYFSVTDWDDVQSSPKHILAILLRRNYKILFIDTLGLRRPSIAKKDLLRVAKRVKKCFKGLIEVEEKFFIFSPIVLPFHKNRIIKKLNLKILIGQLKKLIRNKKLDQPVIISNLPHIVEICRKIPHFGIIYYIRDDYSSAPHLDKEFIWKAEKEMLDFADITLAISENILKSRESFARNIFLMPNAVDFNHFRKALEGELPIPEEIKDIPKPVIYYHGTIENWFDFDLIKFIAGKKRDWRIVLVGPSKVDVSFFNDFSNIIYLGKKDYSNLPLYLQKADVCIIPFVVNNFTLNCDPIKLYEYLAAGKPVVTTLPIREDKYKKYMKFAKNKEEFLIAVEESIKEDNQELAQARSASVNEETWEKRTETIVELMNKYIGHKLHKK